MPKIIKQVIAIALTVSLSTAGAYRIGGATAPIVDSATTIATAQ